MRPSSSDDVMLGAAGQQADLIDELRKGAGEDAHSERDIAAIA
jgi:hypothetical protein